MNGPQGPQNLPNVECPQCGFKHPKLPEGERCPMAKEKTKDGTDINYEQFMRNVRNIMSSQIQTKSIKDPNKMFASLTVEIMKLAENYEEVK